MPKFVASVAHRDTGKDEYLIRDAASERELRDALSDEGVVVRSLRPAEFGGKGARFEIRTLKGRVAGPFGPDILRAMVRDGHLTPHCSIRKTGDLDTHAWLPAWKAKGLFPGHVVDSIRRSHTVTKTDDVDTAKLKALKQQLDDGLIDERDYQFKKGELLGTPYEVDGSAEVSPSHVLGAAETSPGYLCITCDGCGISNEVSCGRCGRPDRFGFDGYAAKCACGNQATMIPCWECGYLNTARSLRWSDTRIDQSEREPSDRHKAVQSEAKREATVQSVTQSVRLLLGIPLWIIVIAIAVGMLVGLVPICPGMSGIFIFGLMAKLMTG